MVCESSTRLAQLSALNALAMDQPGQSCLKSENSPQQYDGKDHVCFCHLINFTQHGEFSTALTRDSLSCKDPAIWRFQQPFLVVQDELQHPAYMTHLLYWAGLAWTNGYAPNDGMWLTLDDVPQNKLGRAWQDDSCVWERLYHWTSMLCDGEEMAKAVIDLSVICLTD